MANRYWVYNGGNINDTTHWSATSGGAGGALKPTLADNVIFDANSFTLNAQVVTLNEAFNCLSTDWTGISKTVTFSSSVYSLNLYGNLTLAANLTWTFTGTAYLNHKSSGTVTTNGIILNANRVYFDAAGITVTNGDAANYGGASFYLTNGTWNTNGKTITSTGSFNTVAGTKTLTLGASVFNIGTWTNAITAGFTLNYNTSTVNITTASILTGVTTFYNLTCSGVATLTLANNITATNALTLAGTSVSNRLKILSSVAGTQRTVTVPAAGVFPSNLDVQDTAFPNAVDMSAITGYSQDFGNNTGIAFTASTNLFFKHTLGAANWGDITKWFLVDRSTQGRIPLIQDDVNFDNLSFTGTSTVSLNVAATCRSVNWTGLNQAVTLSSAVNSLSIYGHTTLATGLIWTFTGTAFTYIIAGATNYITCNGVSPMMNVLYMDSINHSVYGTIINNDDFNIQGAKVIPNYVTWNTNGKTISIGEERHNTNGTFTWVLGSSVVNLIGVNYGGYGGFVINGGASILNVYATFVNANSSILGDINFTGNICGIINAMPSCKNITKLTSGVLTFTAVNTLNISGSLIIKGINSTTGRCLLANGTIGSQCSIPAANVEFENVDFRDIKGLGTANWDLSVIPGGSGDCGGNSNITFTPSQAQYYKHTSGACNWSDAKWYDYARTTLGRVPLPQDDAMFDGSSFVGDSTLTINVPRICRNLDMSGVGQSLGIILNPAVTEIYGGVSFGVNVIFIGTGKTFKFYSQGLTSGSNISIINGSTQLVIQIYRGIYTFASNIIADNVYMDSLGTLYFGNFDITVNWLYATGNPATMYFENSNINIMGTAGTPLTLYSSSVIYAGTSTIKFINSIPAFFNINVLGKALNKLWLSGVSVGSLNSLGSMTVNELILDAGRAIKFTTGTTTTIGKLTAIGTQSQPITIGSITAAAHSLVKTGADMVEVEYCNIRNSNATPSDKWSGGDTSVDGGGNSGWTFKFIPIIMWFFGIFSKK